MTLLPASIFDTFRNRLLYLSAHKASIYHWGNNELGSSYLFDVTEDGLNNFERYLRETPNHPVYLLVDVFEEEYRSETIPHVSGPDRSVILERKKARLFSSTPYVHARILGRENRGRRGDRVLFSALTNPDLISRYVELLDKYRVPLIGIHSLPLFTEFLLRKFPDRSEHMLIVSLQSISGLRQTFFQNGEFRISRLIQMPRYGAVSYFPFIHDEVEKIQRYLSSMYLISINKSLDIYFLLAGELMEEVKEHYEDTPMVKYHLLDLNKLIDETSPEQQFNTPFSDRFFAYSFFKARPANCYGTSRDTRYARLGRINFVMLAISVVLLVCGFIWSGVYFVEGLTLKQNSLSVQSKAEFYSGRYQIARERLPRTAVEPNEIKTAVDIASTLNEYKTSPIEMFRTLSHGLNHFPAIKLESIDWITSTDPDLNLYMDSNQDSSERSGIANASFKDTDYKFYQIAQFSGYLDPFDGDFRKAIELINSFAETIRQSDAVYHVSVVISPLDLSSTASLHGDTRVIQNDARFSIRVTLGISSET